MLIKTSKGLYCPAGNFYIDPSSAVDHAVVTHAHSDHARRGSKSYYCVNSGLGLLKARVGQKISARSFAYGESFSLGHIKLSFHPAGHILGSSQVRLENSAGEVWVASGDYKREPDPTCEPFESVSCDVFVTEATFGTPSFVWPRDIDLGRQIHDWWMKNSAQGVNSVLFAYSLGKTQRVLGVLAPFATRPIYCHSAAAGINNCYRAQGIQLAETICLSTVAQSHRPVGELFLVPPAFLKTDFAEILGDRMETAFASGWMANGGGFRGGGYDHGFVMSDHADWNDLVRTIRDTGARRIYVQHRGQGALVKYLRKEGFEAFPEDELRQEVPDQLALF